MVLFDILLNLIYPTRCVSCGLFGSYFCADCKGHLETIHTPICPVCTRPALFGETHPRCMTRYRVDGLVSVFRYTGPVRSAIKLLKYRRVTNLTASIVDEMMSALDRPSKEHTDFTRILSDASTVIVPIPIHWWRKRRRLFNQADLIAEALASRCKIPVQNDLLIRVRYTAPQAEQHRFQRLRNMKGAFALNPKIKIQRVNSIVLIDDVWTTGATMREAANVLKRGGVKTVWGLTIAR